jgi:N-acetylglucosamine-6-sulfatase
MKSLETRNQLNHINTKQIETPTSDELRDLSHDILNAKNAGKFQKLGAGALLSGTMSLSNLSGLEPSNETVLNESESTTTRVENLLWFEKSSHALPNGDAILFEEPLNPQENADITTIPVSARIEVSPEEHVFNAIRRPEENEQEMIFEAKNRKVNTAEIDDNRPDVIFIMVDDLGYLNDQRILRRMPNIKRVLIEGGMRFTDMFATTPLCGPSRANMLTGQNTLHTGVKTNNGNLLKPRSTIAYALQKDGQHTVQTGKYINNYDGNPKVPVGWDKAVIFYNDNDDKLANTASELITQAPADEPLFAWFSSTAPHAQTGSTNPNQKHLPYVPPQYRGAPECQGLKRYKPPTYKVWDKPKPPPRNMPNWAKGWKFINACESLLAVDKMLGRVEEAQKERGRPVYFILVSDNGMSWGQKGFPGKGVPTSTRLPFYVAGPGIEKGSTTNALISSIDIAPTIADITGVNLPNADGRSFLQILKGDKTRIRREMLEIMPSGKEQWSAIRRGDWRLIRKENGDKKLYRVSEDIWERRNLTKKRPALTKELNKGLTHLIQKSRR